MGKSTIGWNTRFIIPLQLENNQEGNTWFSTRGAKPDVQLHIDHEFYKAMGEPEEITVEIQLEG